MNAAATPTWLSRPSSSYRPSSSEPTPWPSLWMRNPATHAVGGALVLDLDQRALVGLVRARRAAWPRRRRGRRPRTRENQSAATAGSVLAGVMRHGRALAPHARRAARPAVRANGRSSHDSSPSASRSKATNDARRLGGQPAHPRLGGVDALQQGVEVEAVAVGVGRRRSRRRRRTARAARARSGLEQLGEVAGERAFLAAGQLDLVAVAERRCSGSRPTSARNQPAVAGPGIAAGQLGQHRLDRQAAIGQRHHTIVLVDDRAATGRARELTGHPARRRTLIRCGRDRPRRSAPMTISIPRSRPRRGRRSPWPRRRRRSSPPAAPAAARVDDRSRRAAGPDTPTAGGSPAPSPSPARARSPSSPTRPSLTVGVQAQARRPAPAAMDAARPATPRR